MVYQAIELTSSLDVTLVDFMGNDLQIVNAARVSLNQHEDEMSTKNIGLVNFLMSNKHASPFEHCTVSLLVEAPIFVVREWHRHRTQSYNEMSGRYTELQPKFYAPDYGRPLIQVGKPGAYRFEVPEGEELYHSIWSDVRFSAQTAWDTYQHFLEQGVAKEVARNVLPVNIYTKWYATGNLRNMINFISLRADEQALWEIRQLANQVEEILTVLYPVTMKTWNESGRGAI